MPKREPFLKRVSSDLTVVGGGLSGVCAAITAARLGLDVVLIHDRPVLGGNSSSEIRLWVLGASCYGRSPNRYAREGGVMEELYVENRYRNPEGNPVIWDTILLDWVSREPNLTLLLDTAVFDLEMDGDRPNRIRTVKAFSALTQTVFLCESPLFLDASGDGIIGLLAGADFRMGREARHEFQESFAPDTEDRMLLGSSIYFVSRKADRPVRFIPPAFALDIRKTDIPKYRRINPVENGPEFWWIEYGGHLDTVHQAGDTKWKLWQIVYGIWDYIKNSGTFNDTENLTLEWVGTLPGKRESRRFIGDSILTQNDIETQKRFDDAVAVGGWPIDLHPSDGVFSKDPACNQVHPEGVYTIPYRSYYSRNIENLFLAGRLISCSHVAFGSTRVMGTCAAGAQAAGAAAFLCGKTGLLPKDLTDGTGTKTLQRLLLREAQDIHFLRDDDPNNVASGARVRASSHRVLTGFDRVADQRIPLDEDFALMFPVVTESLCEISIPAAVREDTEISVRLCSNERGFNYVPNVDLWSKRISLGAADNTSIVLHPDIRIENSGFIWLIIEADEKVSLYTSDDKAVGVIALKPEKRRELHHHYEGQLIWKPRKQSVAFSLDPPQDCYSPKNAVNGYARPYVLPNCWISEAFQPGQSEWIELRWNKPETIYEIDILCNSDLDNPLETAHVAHQNRMMNETLKDLDVLVQLSDGTWREIGCIKENHHRRVRIPCISETIQAVKAVCHAANCDYPHAEIYEIRAYASSYGAYVEQLKSSRQEVK